MDCWTVTSNSTRDLYRVIVRRVNTSNNLQVAGDRLRQAKYLEAGVFTGEKAGEKFVRHLTSQKSFEQAASSRIPRFRDSFWIADYSDTVRDLNRMATLASSMGHIRKAD